MFSIATIRVVGTCPRSPLRAAARTWSVVNAPGHGRKRPRHQPRVHGRPAELGDQDVRQSPRRSARRRARRARAARSRSPSSPSGRRPSPPGRAISAAAPLELVDGRILADLLVADLGVRDRLAHRRRRLRRRVGTEVDHVSWPAVARVPVREHEQVGVHLRLVAQAVQAELSPSRAASARGRSRSNQASSAMTCKTWLEHPAEDEARESRGRAGTRSRAGAGRPAPRPGGRSG